jgi:hypothetical protein
MKNNAIRGFVFAAAASITLATAAHAAEFELKVA